MTRRAISLLEVLIAMFVLAIGLLGLAALIPLGRFTIMEMNKADYSGACGRAALRDVKIRDTLDANAWDVNPWTPLLPFDDRPDIRPIVIDPLGRANGLTGAVGNLLPRVTMNRFDVLPATAELRAAQEGFLWKDDRVFTIPSEGRPRRLFYDSGGNVTDDRTAADRTQGPVIKGHYSWLVTLSPSPSEGKSLYKDDDEYGRRSFRVSVAVCYRRNFDTAAEKFSAVSFVGGIGFGGGTIVLNNALGIEEVKEGEWVLLCDIHEDASIRRGAAQWYRVVSIGVGPSGNPALTLNGPDWDVGMYPNPTVVLIPTILGVYSECVETDIDSL